MEWDVLKKVDNVLYPTYKDTWYARRLLQDDKEYIDELLEANSMSQSEVVWEKTWTVMATDVLNVERIKQNKPALELLYIQRKNICLTYIECMLRSNNRSLKDIQNMTYADQEYTMDGYNKLIFDETSYNKDKLKEQHVKLYGNLTSEQKDIYSTVMNAVDNDKEGGRTTHSRFAIPINVVEDSMCHIGADSKLAELICKAKLIIWDEAPMINRNCYEAFDRTLRDICMTDPSVASDKDVVNATINASYLWDKCTVLRLTINMRLGSGSTQSEKKEIQEFADWILDIGNGKVGGANDGVSTVVFPDNMLIPETDDDVGDEKDYESLDSVCLADEDSNFDDSIYITEFLNSIRMSGIPHHNIKLKIGTPIMLMRNIDQRAGMCNGTRLQVLRMGNIIIEAKIISGGSVGTICAIPRMIISPTDTKMPFKLNRRQFPIQVCFTMTINKSQGQNLS
ncbi:ATP-dependent DNA helicase RRM3-like protein [Tanacetum coccineum]|uniref:ATP-dependent DNA helicase n=1 Tax=Tanacetum coccineum TaxID=301880 RepID=A0ABQ4Z4C9_9ASTR